MLFFLVKKVVNYQAICGVKYWAYFIMRYLCNILIFIAIIGPTSLAQVSNIKFKHLTSKEGLSNDIVYRIIQDYKGFIWIATENGLHQYNGYNLVNYTHIPRDLNSIGGNIIFDIVEDKEHNLWVATSTGLDLFNRNTRSFIHIPYIYYNSETNKYDSLYGTNPRSLYIDKDGSLLVGTSGHGVLKVPLGKRTLGPITLDTTWWREIVKIYDIKSVCRGKDGLIWLSNQNMGVYSLDQTARKIRFYKFKKNSHFYSYYLSSVREDSHGTLWAATEYGLNIYDRKNDRFIPFLNENAGNKSVPNLNTTHVFEDTLKNIWISTNLGSINIYNYKTEAFTSIIRDKFDPYSFSSDLLNSCYIDKQGMLWVATNRGGVNFAPFYNAYKFEQILYSPSDKGLSHPSIGAVFEDSKGNLWIGSDGGGLHVMDAQTGKIQNYKHDPKNPRSIGSNFILAIEEDIFGTIWVGGYKAGLNKFNRSTSDFTVYRKIENDTTGLAHDDVRSIVSNDDGTLWIASNGGGIQLFNIKKEKFNHPFSHRPEMNLGTWCLKTYKDSHSNMWFLSYYGLARYEPKSGKIKIFRNEGGNDTTSISNNWVYCITEDKHGNYWVGTESGLNIINYKNDHVTHITTQEGLPSNIINGILTDEEFNIWIGTDMGLVKYEDKTGKFTSFDKNDGLPGNQFIHGSYHKSSKGFLYFGTTSGLLKFNPKEIKGNSFAPDVFFTDLLINYKKAEVGGKKDPISKDVSEADKVILRYGQSTVTFKYVALNFLNSEKNQYAYMLEGFDKGWNYVGNKRDATYTNLDQGNYVFRVKASNNNGIWNEKGSSIKVVVLPPWWSSWWFRWLSVIFVIVSAITFYYYRTSSLKRQQRQLEKMVGERTMELQEMNARLEEKQEEIMSQKEELLSQKDSLTELNQELYTHQEFIIKQNEELDKHRFQLEYLVKQRTLELENAMKKAEEGDRLKTAFLANMSHEIRTPLNAIVGFTNLIIDSDFNLEEKKEFEKIINRNTENLLKLINDILDLSRIEAGEVKTIKTSVNINELMKSLKMVFMKLIVSQHRENLLFNYRPYNGSIEDVVIKTDSYRLNQILTNLLDNAVKYTTSGKIDFGYKIVENTFIEFFVSDTGIGIPKEHLENIFYRFNKIETDTSRLSRGAGLGLAISRQLAHLLGGSIWAESEPGKGSCFYLRIPYEKAEKQENLSKTDTMQEIVDLSGKIILVAEDEDNNYRMIESSLKKTNAQLIRAHTGPEAFELYEKNRPHIILMDIKLPILSGAEVVKRIREVDKYTPIIAQTAYALQDEENNFKSSGFNDYIAKPYKPKEILEIIQKNIV